MRVEDFKIGKLYRFAYANPEHQLSLRLESTWFHPRNKVCSYIHHNEIVTFLDYKKKSRSWRGYKFFYHCTKVLKSDGTMGWLIQENRSYRPFELVVGNDFG